MGWEMEASLTKLDSNFNITWSKVYRGMGSQISDLIETSVGEYILCGTTYINSPDDFHDIMVITKVDGNGNPVWQQHFTGLHATSHARYAARAMAWSVRDTSFIVGGYTDHFSAGQVLPYLVKMDVNGGIISSKSLHTGGIGDFIRTADGGHLLAGGAVSAASPLSSNGLLIKLDSLENIEWAKTFSGTGSHWFTSVQATSDGGYIMAGSIKGVGSGSDDIYLLKCDHQGNYQWSYAYGGPASDVAYHVLETSDQHYVITGTIRSFGAQFSSALFLKVDAVGNIVAGKEYGGSGQGAFSFGAVQVKGGFLISGGITYDNATRSDIYLIKTDALGYSSCDEMTPSTARIAVNSPDTGITIMTGVGGTGFNSMPTVLPGLQDTILCSTILSAKALTSVGKAHISVQPNPASSYVAVHSSESGVLHLYDDQGRLRKRVAVARSSTTRIDIGDNFSAGVYFYHFTADSGNTASGKLVVVR
jgi:hypothetical protein